MAKTQVKAVDESTASVQADEAPVPIPLSAI
jgi:hypothetical protein